jgi:hypothetical protein
VGHAGPSKPYDTATGGNRAGRVTNCYKRFDLKNPKARVPATVRGDRLRQAAR